MKYVHRRIEVEAIQYNGSNKEDIREFVKGEPLTGLFSGHCIIEKDDWIVKKGDNFYLYPPKIFEEMFEELKMESEINENEMCGMKRDEFREVDEDNEEKVGMNMVAILGGIKIKIPSDKYGDFLHMLERDGKVEVQATDSNGLNYSIILQSKLDWE